MKLRIEHGELSPAVSRIAHYISDKSTQPELAGVILETFQSGGESYLRLISYNGNATGKAVAKAEVEETGRVLIPGRIFTQIVRDMDKKTVSLETVPDENVLEIKVGTTGRYRLTLIDDSNYPQLPVKPEEAGRIEAKFFADAVNQVARAASKDDEGLSGIRLEVSSDSMTLLATDRYRLAVRTIPWEGTTEEPFTADVAASVLRGAASQFARTGEIQVSMESGNSNFALANNTSAVIVQQHSSNIPEGVQDKLVRKEHTAVAVFDIAAVAAKAKIIANFATETGSVARFKFSKDLLTISGASSALSASGGEEVPIEYDGETMEIAFNPTFFLDGLDALGTEKAEIGLVNENAPAVLKAIGGTGDFAYVVVPVRQNR